MSDDVIMTCDDVIKRSYQSSSTRGSELIYSFKDPNKRNTVNKKIPKNFKKCIKSNFQYKISFFGIFFVYFGNFFFFFYQ